MNAVTVNQVVECLQLIGLEYNDGLLVHSAVQYLGKPEGGVGIYYKALRSILGDGGTIVVPAFSFSFAQKKEFDPVSTPSEKMGVFSEFVRKLPGALRSQHPMQSYVFIGKMTEELASRNTLSAFDPGSAIEKMIQSNFKLLLLGASIQAASVIHYSEQRANVPYRYWKEFPGEIKINGEWRHRTYKMFVRDLKIDPQLNINRIQDELIKKGQWKSVDLNYGKIACCRMQDFVNVADEMLARDPWIFVSNRQPDGLKAGAG